MKTSGKRLLFIYGEYDPWTAGAFELGNATQSLKLIVPAGNHSASISRLTDADKTRATTRMFETVQDGVLQRSWCIIPGDPPGTYTYDITIDGEPRGEFVFCAIEVPNQDLNTDPRDLSCPNKFNSVQRAPTRPGSDMGSAS